MQPNLPTQTSHQTAKDALLGKWPRLAKGTRVKDREKKAQTKQERVHVRRKQRI